jgi:serine/threonine protein phosphatase 1
MSGRIIAIGDIHGHAKALATLVELVRPARNDNLVTLGNYVDRGPDTKGVLDRLLELQTRCQLIPLMGNHEEMMQGAREGRSDFEFWMKFGGDAALDSYGPGRTMNQVPREHWEFLKRLPLCHEADGHFFAHANYAPNQPWNQQSSQVLLWLDLADLPGPHFSGKTAIVGHTPQNSRQVLDLGHLMCIDTGCGHGGLLTALDVTSGRIWQVTESGREV